MTKKRAKKSSYIKEAALIGVAIILSMVLGFAVGMWMDPLPPATCAARLAQIGAPHGVDSFVCYGQRPN